MSDERSTPIETAADVDPDLLMRLLRRVEADHHRHGWDQPARLMVVYDERDEYTSGVYRRILNSPNHGAVPTVRVAPYVAQTFLPPALLHGYRTDGKGIEPGERLPVWEYLRRFAMNLAYAPVDALADSESGREFSGDTGVPPLELMRGMLRLPGLLGYVFCSESWRRALTSEQMLAEQRSEQTPNYGDQPDSVEVRVVYCVDLFDRVHVVERDRGDRPTTVMTESGPRTVIQPGQGLVRQEQAALIRGDTTTSLRILADMSMGRTPPQELFDQWYPTLRTAMESARRDELLGPKVPAS